MHNGRSPEAEKVTVYGYARVSAAGQEHERQVDALRAAGCERVFAEKASAAADRARPMLAAAIKNLSPGDVLIVTALDRLARSTRDALNAIATLHARGARFRSLAEPWADTTTAHGQLALTIFAGFAEFDRSMILRRTAAGRARAVANGKRMGRPPILNAAQMRVIREETAAGRAGAAELAAILGVSVNTVKRAQKRLRDAATPADDPAAIHAPDCAIHTTGLGCTVRCTCGREAPPTPRQVDLEELTAQR